jgi:NSS family neurotransmitter:Na+ symporter
MMTGDFSGLSVLEVEAEYAGMLGDPWMQLLFTGIVIAIGFLVCSFGVAKSLERVTKIMMLALLAIMLVLAVNGFFLDGAAEGLKFYLVPNFDTMREVGIFNIITGAMSQAFFTLSIGIGSMAIFGSYLSKDRALLGEAVNVALLDTSVAFIAGLIIFPACFTYNGGNVNAGPPLIFVTLPNIFNHMPLGRLWGSLFFLFLAFAALSTVFAVFEHIIACLQDLFGWSRKKTCLIGAFGMLLLSIPCILGYNAWAGFRPFGEGTAILDLEDFLVSNILLPVGALLFVLFCTTRYGWGLNKFTDEANTGKGMKVLPFMRGYMKYALPVIMLFFLVISVVTFFI